MIGVQFPLFSLTSPSCPPSLARIGGFVAPFIAGLGVRDPSLPFLIFGGAAVVSIIIFIMRMRMLKIMIMTYDADADIHRKRPYLKEKSEHEFSQRQPNIQNVR